MWLAAPALWVVLEFFPTKAGKALFEYSTEKKRARHLPVAQNESFIPSKQGKCYNTIKQKHSDALWYL
jgi:hypothetical protein